MAPAAPLPLPLPLLLRLCHHHHHDHMTIIIKSLDIIIVHSIPSTNEWMEPRMLLLLLCRIYIGLKIKKRRQRSWRHPWWSWHSQNRIRMCIGKNKIEYSMHTFYDRNTIHHVMICTAPNQTATHTIWIGRVAWANNRIWIQNFASVLTMVDISYWMGGSNFLIKINQICTHTLLIGCKCRILGWRTFTGQSIFNIRWS